METNHFATGVIIALIVFIALALGTALFHLVRGSNDLGTVRALTWRIGLSLTLFLGLFFAFVMGWITPHGLAQ